MMGVAGCVNNRRLQRDRAFAIFLAADYLPTVLSELQTTEGLIVMLSVTFALIKQWPTQQGAQRIK